MTYGSFRTPKEAVKRFVSEKLITPALTPNPPETFNLEQQFAAFLATGSFNRFRAEEEAEKQINFIRRQLGDALNEWSRLGIPSPVQFTENEEVLLTWKHNHFQQITGHRAISRNFIEIYEWLSGLQSREFLLACVSFLKLLRCDPIFITDGRGDEGIDCIGKIADGPLRSVAVFIQSKTKENDLEKLGRDALFQEYGKYAVLPKTDKYREYLNALRFKEILDGSATLYVMLSNVEFKREAQEVAKNLGILLRSKRQLAFYLSLNLQSNELRALQANHTIPNGPDLSTNIAAKICLSGPNEIHRT